jgi:ankyrin repeat protein
MRNYFLVMRNYFFPNIANVSPEQQSNARQSELNRQLLAATLRGDNEKVQMLLEQGADIEARDFIDQTALMIAAFFGPIEMLQLLLDRGANIEARCGDGGEIALTNAAERGHTEMVQLLLDRGANIEAKDRQDTALIIAAEKGHKAIVQLLLDYKAKIDVRGAVGGTALMRAADHGHTEIVQLLLNKGANAHIRDNYDYTPLKRAASFNKIATSKQILNFILKDQGKNPNNLLLLLESRDLLDRSVIRSITVETATTIAAMIVVNQDSSLSDKYMQDIVAFSAIYNSLKENPNDQIDIAVVNTLRNLAGAIAQKFASVRSGSGQSQNQNPSLEDTFKANALIANRLFPKLLKLAEQQNPDLTTGLAFLLKLRQELIIKNGTEALAPANLTPELLTNMMLLVALDRQTEEGAKEDGDRYRTALAKTGHLRATEEVEGLGKSLTSLILSFLNCNSSLLTPEENQRLADSILIIWRHDATLPEKAKTEAAQPAYSDPLSENKIIQDPSSVVLATGVKILLGTQQEQGRCNT